MISNKNDKQKQHHLTESSHNYQHQIVYQCQNQLLSNKSNMPTTKELIVKMDDNYPYSYSLEPTTSSISYDNNTSSSRSLINMPAQITNHKKESSNNNTKIDCKNIRNDQNKTNNNNNKKNKRAKKFIKMEQQHTTDDYSTGEDNNFNQEEVINNNTNPRKYHQSNKRPKEKKCYQNYSTCYLVQQYFIYLLLCFIIICSSFGFYCKFFKCDFYF